MVLEWIALARSWHLFIRVGIATIAVAAATALQLSIETGMQREPFLFYFAIVVVSASALGRIPGYVAVVETIIASSLYFDPIFSIKLNRALDLAAIEAYAVLAALTVEAFCRLVDSALAERSDAHLARVQ